MLEAQEARRARRWRSFSEKRQRSELSDTCSALLPVAVAGVNDPPSERDQEQHAVATSLGSIHIEPPGRGEHQHRERHS